jgi:UDP-N-acetylglucosamine--N-acetylmuramyl-(pentapeptide) pyrophosphoryl-undecaprenol N-acetylglucosamine transferase
LIEKIIFTQKTIFTRESIYYPKPKKNIKFFLFLYYSIIVFFKIFYTCYKKKPSKIYATGGFFAIPFAICAAFFSIPFYLYHLDVIPGTAGRIIGILPSIMQCVIYDDTKKYIYKQSNVLRVSYPIRYEEKDKKDIISAKKIIDKSDYFIFFILGGSQGSQEINEYMTAAIPLLIGRKIYIIHQSGKNDKFFMQEIYKKNMIESLVFDYDDNIVNYYNAADMIIARAGAGIMAEINFFNKQAIIIPLRFLASDHQYKNGEYYSSKNENINIVLNKKDFYHTIYNIFI